jgi:hypothetical protein
MSEPQKDDRDQSAHPLEYQRPTGPQQPGTYRAAAAFGVFFVSVIAGCLFTLLYIRLMESLQRDVGNLIYGSLLIKIVAAIVLIPRPGWRRSAGIGLLVSIPIGVFIFFAVLCGPL